ncbi:MAG: tetratricopeptide repeat protein [Verrucomicrobia bacterium]|nr:tetratricopeptide repeat protein [Verrucomicrobiota bacterium]
MANRNFFSELKRRNVYKVAVAYAVASWLLIQIATQVFPFFEIPNWAVRLVVLILIAGFPVALIFSWAFEITPEGIKRESEIEADKSITHHTGRKIIWITVVLAVAAAGLLGFQFFGPKFSGPAKSETLPISNKSIAVLPFDNLSRDPDNAYFCEGVQDEILTRLAKVADLKVISRTSTQHFKSSPENLPQIAKQLGVMHILEGSVQKAGNQVRVNVQLINAMNDAHLWADTFDRQLTDIFAAESEIAKNIAEKLQAKITGSEKNSIAKAPTENPEAHELYLKGRYFWNRRNAENLKKAADYFQRAIDKDSKYALAYAGLADCHVLLPAYPGLGNTPRDEWPKALEAARNAVGLDDTLAEGHTSLARVLASTLQLSAATSEFRRAIDLNPNYATAHQWFGECLQSQGQLQEALAEIKRAQELDPLSLVISALYGFALDTVGKSEDAIAQLRKTIEIDSNFENAHGMLGVVLEHNGRLKEAIAEYEKNISLHEDAISLSQLAGAYFLAGRKEDAQQLWNKLKALSDRQYTPAYSMAVVQSSFGNKDEAIRLLEKSYEDHAPFDSNDLGWILVDHRLDPLRSDPRFKKLITRIFSGERR